MPHKDESSVAIRAAATVIPVRDGPKGIEVLLILRNPKLDFYGGVWVFPGGRVDDEDNELAKGDPLLAARRAAAREAREESGLVLLPEDMIAMSHWTTPEGQPKRFATWFFVTIIGEQCVQIDGAEALDHRWLTPAKALVLQREGDLKLMPPTFVSLWEIAAFTDADHLRSYLRRRDPLVFVPRVRIVPGGFCTLYPGDRAYDGGELELPGPRHRLWGLDEGWRYERTQAGRS